MFDLEFKINGRKVRPDQMEKELEKAMFADIKKEMADKVRRIRCPKHGQAARVTPRGHSIKQLSWSVEGCCDELIDRVKKAIA